MTRPPEDGLEPAELTGTDAGRRTLDELLRKARACIDRLEPAAAHAAMAAGALLIDIRSVHDRARDGIVPGSLHLPRTVLEWRVDPDSPARNPNVGGLERQLLVMCDHGYSSSFAAAALVELGFSHTADVIGGFDAWRDAGLPVCRAPRARRRPGEPAGMRPPD